MSDTKAAHPLESVAGKRIAGVVGGRIENRHTPSAQVVIVFDDGTMLELAGLLNVVRVDDPGGMRGARRRIAPVLKEVEVFAIDGAPEGEDVEDEAQSEAVTAFATLFCKLHDESRTRANYDFALWHRLWLWYMDPLRDGTDSQRDARLKSLVPLWNEATGTAGYHKGDWSELDSLVQERIGMLAEQRMKALLDKLKREHTEIKD